MSEQAAPEPAEERRGGKNPDWAGTRPGKPLPEKQPETAPEDTGR